MTENPMTLRDALRAAVSDNAERDPSTKRAMPTLAPGGRLASKVDRDRPSTDTPTSERVTLTDAERERLYESRVSVRYDYRTEFPPDGQRAVYAEGDLHAVVEQILTDRRAAWEAEVRAQVKADIYARNDSGLDLDNLPEWDDSCMSHDEAWVHGLADAARIAGGDQ